MAAKQTMLAKNNRFTELERHLLDDYQHNLPMSLTPYADIAMQLGVGEDEVLDTLRRLQHNGVISRVGPVFTPNRVGASTLAAMAVPQDEISDVADFVSSFAEVNHNYEREHDFNLWFVVTASNPNHLQQVLHDIERLSGHSVMVLPMLEDYYIDLGFKITWE